MRRCPSVVAVAVTMFAFAGASAQSQTPAAPRTTVVRNLPEVRFTNIPLNDCINFLRDVSGANINVNWRALELLNVTPDTMINLRVRSVTVRKALNMILAEAAPGGLLTWYAEDNVIEVTTREIADSRLLTIVYPVEDLLVEIPNFEGPEFSLEDSGGNSGSSGSGSSGGNLFGDSSSSGNQENEETKTKAERAEDLVTLIRDVVRPDIWRENGGPASIRYFNGNLIVLAPRSVHEAIGGTRMFR